MTQVRAFTGTVIDEYGRIDGAYIAIYGVYSRRGTKLVATNTTDSYTRTSDVEAITYNANYWYNYQTQLDGYRSRPLKVEEDGVLSNILTVDITHPDIVSILSQNLEQEESDLACAESDYNRRII